MNFKLEKKEIKSIKALSTICCCEQQCKGAGI